MQCSSDDEDVGNGVGWQAGKGGEEDGEFGGCRQDLQDSQDCWALTHQSQSCKPCESCRKQQEPRDDSGQLGSSGGFALSGGRIAESKSGAAIGSRLQAV